MRKRTLYTLATILFIATFSTLIILYAKGYSLDIKKGTLQKSGILLIKSIPDGAKIFLSEPKVEGEKLVDVTNTSIASLSPGIYKVRLEKEGYHSWDKEVPVKEELVTEILALLVAKTPSLTPLTSTGVKSATFSSDGENVVYYTSSKGKTGLWFMPLKSSGTTLISRNNLRLIVEDPSTEFFAETKLLSFSPDNDEVLVSVKNDSNYFLLSTGKLNTQPLESTSSAEPTLNLWKTLRVARRKQLVEKFKLETELTEIALRQTTTWSPDKTKFLYSYEEGNEIEYRVYNAKKPLGVGEAAINTVLRTNNDRELTVTWHSDSRHLIIVEEEEINLVEIDGKNLTPVFSGPLSSQDVYPTLDGRGVIILTTFSSKENPNLYVIRLN